MSYEVAAFHFMHSHLLWMHKQAYPVKKFHVGLPEEAFHLVTSTWYAGSDWHAVDTIILSFMRCEEAEAPPNGQITHELSTPLFFVTA